MVKRVTDPLNKNTKDKQRNPHYTIIMIADTYMLKYSHCS